MNCIQVRYTEASYISYCRNGGWVEMGIISNRVVVSIGKRTPAYEVFKMFHSSYYKLVRSFACFEGLNCVVVSLSHARNRKVNLLFGSTVVFRIGKVTPFLSVYSPRLYLSCGG